MNPVPPRPTPPCPAPAPVAAPATSSDPELCRLRGLLRMQARAAEAGDWAAFRALTARVGRELERPAPQRAPAAVLAEIAHLQARLEAGLRRRARRLEAEASTLAAARTYRSHAATGGTGPRGR